MSSCMFCFFYIEKQCNFPLNCKKQLWRGFTPLDQENPSRQKYRPLQCFYRDVLLRSTLTGSGPASLLSSDWPIVIAITGVKWQGLTFWASSMYSLSPLMLSCRYNIDYKHLTYQIMYSNLYQSFFQVVTFLKFIYICWILVGCFSSAPTHPFKEIFSPSLACISLVVFV